MKKIFAILSILLILSAVIFPTFAYTELNGSLSIYNYGFSQDFSYTQANDGYNSSWSRGVSLDSGTYAILCYSNPSSVGQRPFQFFVYGNNIPTRYGLTDYNQFQISPLLITLTARTNITFQLSSYSAGTYNIHFSVFIFQVNSTSTQSEISSLLSSYDVDITNDYPRGQYSFMYGGTQNGGFINFYEALMHSFDYIGNNAVHTMPIFVFIFPVILIALFVLIIILLIKRCKS